MKKNQWPVLCFEATITLYPADASGEALTGYPIYCGAPANAVRLPNQLEEKLVSASGALYKEAKHTDQILGVEIERSWVLRVTDFKDFELMRNGKYVLEIVWASGGYWYKRTYYGVTGRSADLASNGVLQFGATQVFRAQYFKAQGGTGNASAGVFTPLPPSPNGEELSIGFFRENAVVPGEYFLGYYKWQKNVQIKSAKAIMLAGQGASTVLELEVNGELTGKQVTVAAGAVGAEVSGESAFTNYVVGAGQSVRWKVVSGPANVEDLATSAGLVMQAIQV